MTSTPEQSAKKKSFYKPSLSEIPTPLTLDEIRLFKELPALTLDQIARVLQKPIKHVYEISRKRANRPLPVVRVGKSLYSTYPKIEQWIADGFAERGA
jgi:hypothetical protein